MPLTYFPTKCKNSHFDFILSNQYQLKPFNLYSCYKHHHNTINISNKIIHSYFILSILHGQHPLFFHSNKAINLLFTSQDHNNIINILNKFNQFPYIHSTTRPHIYEHIHTAHTTHLLTPWFSFNFIPHNTYNFPQHEKKHKILALSPHQGSRPCMVLHMHTAMHTHTTLS